MCELSCRAIQFTNISNTTITNDGSEKPLVGVFHKKKIQLYMYQIIDYSDANLPKNRARHTAGCFCGHKNEAMSSRKITYPTDGPQINQISLCTRQGDPEDSIN